METDKDTCHIYAERSVPLLIEIRGIGDWLGTIRCKSSEMCYTHSHLSHKIVGREGHIGLGINVYNLLRFFV
jgi:hypothetical protein